MKFSIGYNHDLKLFDLLQRYQNNIEAVYFPIPKQFLSTCRHIPQTKSYRREIDGIIQRCNTLKFKSQLVLNATCDGSEAFEKKSFLRMAAYIEKLLNGGLKSLVVANPVYIREIRKIFNKVEIESSVNSYVKTVEHALYLKELGVDILAFDNNINRDIPLIKRIKEKTGLRLKIVLTEACLRNCPFEKTHWNFIAHRDARSLSALLPNTERWGEEIFLKDPSRIFRSPFIPPEGLKYYTPFIDYFKIGSRDASTRVIEIRLKAYSNQSFEGNLLNLLDCVCVRPYFEYIDAGALKEKRFFEKLLACNGHCEKCGFCNKLVDDAVVTNSYFLGLSNPIRLKENEKAVKMYEKIAAFSPNKTEIYLKLAKALFFLKQCKKWSGKPKKK